MRTRTGPPPRAGTGTRAAPRSSSPLLPTLLGDEFLDLVQRLAVGASDDVDEGSQQALAGEGAEASGAGDDLPGEEVVSSQRGLIAIRMGHLAARQQALAMEPLQRRPDSVDADSGPRAHGGVHLDHIGFAGAPQVLQHPAFQPAQRRCEQVASPRHAYILGSQISDCHSEFAKSSTYTMSSGWGFRPKGEAETRSAAQT